MLKSRQYHLSYEQVQTFTPVYSNSYLEGVEYKSSTMISTYCRKLYAQISHKKQFISTKHKTLSVAIYIVNTLMRFLLESKANFYE